MERRPQIAMGFFTVDGLKEYVGYTSIYILEPNGISVAQANPMYYAIAEIKKAKRIQLTHPIATEIFHN